MSASLIQDGDLASGGVGSLADAANQAAELDSHLCRNVFRQPSPPRLRGKPGQAFEYTSWVPLPTPHGSMRGSYQMVTEEGDEFDAQIAPFPLALPYSLN